MNIDPKQLQEERLRHPNETIRESSASPARASVLTFLSLKSATTQVLDTTTSVHV